MKMVLSEYYGVICIFLWFVCVVIVMEYLEQDLLSFLAMSTSTVIASTLPRAFKELVEGLACLHEKGFLHR